MKIFHLIGFLLMLGTSQFVDPAYPPNAVGGGTVVATFQIGAKLVEQIKINSGEEPFAGAASSALSQWHLDDDSDGEELAVVHFRQPDLYYINGAAETIAGGRATRSLPYPKSIVGPSYPAHGLAQGSVVLRIKVDADGSVGRIETLKSAGALTDVSIEAVRKWEFLAAEDSMGKPTPSHVYAVLVYRFPITQQKK